jgi:3-oxoadipate enol-lactonase
MTTLRSRLVGTAFAALSSLVGCAASAQPVAAGAGSFAAVNDTRLYYEECGTSPQTVVLLHDGGADSAVFDEIWPEFCRHFHVIRYDRRGYGRTPEASSWYYETDDLAALLRHAKVSRAVIVGSSHGGEVAINFTLAHPEVVQQLVLVGAVVGGMPYTEHFLNRGKHADELMAKGDVQGALAEWAQDRYLIAPGNDEARKKLAALLTSHPQDMTHRDLPLRELPALPRLHEIHVPTLLINGDADIPDVHAHAGAIQAGIPGARRIVMSGVGHILYLEKPAEFSRLAIDFIERNRLP